MIELVVGFDWFKFRGLTLPEFITVSGIEDDRAEDCFAWWSKSFLRKHKKNVSSGGVSMICPAIGEPVIHTPTSTRFTVAKRTKHRQSGLIELWDSSGTAYPLDECEQESSPCWLKTAVEMVESVIAGKESIDILSSLEEHKSALWEYLTPGQKKRLKEIKEKASQIPNPNKTSTPYPIGAIVYNLTVKTRVAEAVERTDGWFYRLKPVQKHAAYWTTDDGWIPHSWLMLAKEEGVSQDSTFVH